MTLERAGRSAQPVLDTLDAPAELSRTGVTPERNFTVTAAQCGKDFLCNGLVCCEDLRRHCKSGALPTSCDGRSLGVQIELLCP